MDNISYYILQEQLISVVLNINNKLFEEIINQRTSFKEMKGQINDYEFQDLLNIKGKISKKVNDIWLYERKPFLKVMNELIRENVVHHVLLAEVLEQRTVMNKIVFKYPSLATVLLNQERSKLDHPSDYSKVQLINNCVVDVKSKRFKIIT